MRRAIMAAGTSCFCVALVLAGAGNFAMAWPQATWAVADGGNAHVYELVGNQLNYPNDVWSWQEAKVLAEAGCYSGVQGHLATITSAAENQFILDSFFVTQQWTTWIGLTDSETYGGTESYGSGWPGRQTQGWVWVTGEPVTYTNWAPWADTPANFYDDSDFVAIGNQLNNHRYWGDWLSGTAGHAQYLVEYDLSVAPAPVPEPASLIVWLALGLIGAGIGWRRRGSARHVEK